MATKSPSPYGSPALKDPVKVVTVPIKTVSVRRKN
jgi:hypothetical protein